MPQSHPLPQAEPDLGRIEQVVARLVSEWREARAAVKLTAGSTWSQVASRLGVDRGTAQRLVRIGRMNEVSAAELKHLPGPAGWQSVVHGLTEALGPKHAAVVRLGAACDGYAECIASLGGSKASAERLIDGVRSGGGEAQHSSSRARAEWVKGAARVLGYSVELQLNLQIARPSREKPGRVDIAMVNVFRGCRGTPAAMPFALTRYAASEHSSTVSGSKSDDARSFVMLNACTSRNRPTLLATGDEERQTVFIEPTWGTSSEPMNVGILQLERDAFPNPWQEPDQLFVLSTLNRHACRRLVKVALLDKEMGQGALARFASYRDLALFGQTRHWFDRIPETSVLQTFDPSSPERSVPAFDEYDAVLTEVEERLGWSLSEFDGYLCDVLHPVPLARYSIEFEMAEG